MQNHPNFDNYQIKSANWRSTIARNTWRTRIVILLFFLIYLGLGLLVDLYISSSTYPRASLEQLFYALITFKLLPIATLVMLAVALLSLLVSYALYDKLMLLGTEYHQITPETAQSTAETQLYNIIEEMQIAAGLRFMPKVYIIEADYMNAFASGYSERSAMVAITRGLMQKLNRDELQAVMAHELSHIRHLDIKLTLTATLLANLTLMVLDIFFYNIIFNSDRRSNEKSNNGLAAAIIVLRYVLPVINVILLLYLSRTRELMADAGAVELTRSNQALASALIKISGDHDENRDRYSQEYKQTPHENVRREAYIFDPIQAGISSPSSISDFFSTHPSLDKRLAALGFTRKE